MLTATATASVSQNIFPDRNENFTARPALRGDSTPLSLSDILPDIEPTTEESADSWQSIGEIKSKIISRLSALQAKTK